MSEIKGGEYGLVLLSRESREVEGRKLGRKIGQGGSHYPVKVKGKERRSANRTARQFEGE